MINLFSAFLMVHNLAIMVGRVSHSKWQLAAISIFQHLSRDATKFVFTFDNFTAAMFLGAKVVWLLTVE